LFENSSVGHAFVTNVFSNQPVFKIIVNSSHDLPCFNKFLLLFGQLTVRKGIPEPLEVLGFRWSKIELLFYFLVLSEYTEKIICIYEVLIDIIKVPKRISPRIEPVE
jgi:hypothetical protein